MSAVPPERRVAVEPLEPAAFAPFGQVLRAEGEPDRIINRGLCGRWHDLAALDFGDGRAGISLFRAEPRRLPLVLDLLERHPDGSQAFVPMAGTPWLAIVAPDEAGVAGRPRAFAVDGQTGVNLARGVWHAVLTPLAAPGLFAVIDRIGPGANLEEHSLATPWLVVEAA